MTAVEDWERAGSRERVAGHEIFVRDTGGTGTAALFLHGFPTCGFDWRHVVAGLGDAARCIVPDFLGYGLSDKPPRHAYSLNEQAGIVADIVAAREIEDVVLVTHDIGDSVGGELCARSLDGTLPFGIARRVITNGTIYMDLVELSAGQQLLLALPDEPLPEDQAPNYELFANSLSATFAAPPSEEELRAQWELVAREGGNRLLPRLIRYISERKVHEPRWTGAIERHPSPLKIVWGNADPIARFAMAERLAERTGSPLHVLEDIGHYPNVEAPHAVADAVRASLA
jgi:pimeloyl-ACP methyl ester carboxylesterase